MKRVVFFLALTVALVFQAKAQINLNAATVEEIQQLTFIGMARAQAIVDYRQQHGEFGSMSEMQKVEGVGPATLKLIEEANRSGKLTLSKQGAKLPLTGATTEKKGHPPVKKKSTQADVKERKKIPKKQSLPVSSSDKNHSP